MLNAQTIVISRLLVSSEVNKFNLHYTVCIFIYQQETRARDSFKYENIAWMYNTYHLSISCLSFQWRPMYVTNGPKLTILMAPTTNMSTEKWANFEIRNKMIQDIIEESFAILWCLFILLKEKFSSKGWKSLLLWRFITITGYRKGHKTKLDSAIADVLH